ncbi:galactose mutarotase [bacterium]|nr:galactose mutarotase [bacterium]
MKGLLLSPIIALSLVLSSCKDSATTETSSQKLLVEKQPFGTTPDGQDVKIFKLVNEAGMEANISEYGAILVSLYVPDKDDNALDVTLGHGEFDFDAWEASGAYFGATAGRYGNRIADGRFSIDGTEYQLVKNNKHAGIPCHLHGGVKGFDKVVWSGEAVEKDGATGVKLTYLSKDGEEGYPGNLSATVTYWLTDSNELVFEVEATTDKATPVNIIHHTYWNLSGDHETSINDHLLQINADHFLPTDAGLIPTGEKAAVEGTPMDFRTPTAIGAGVDADFEPLKLAGGYDHCWVLRGEGLRSVVKVTDPKSGRSMELVTDQAGVQFYGGNFLDGKTEGKNGIMYPYRSALCLETECFPDSPNQPSFPNCILKPGDTYRHTLIHRFSW